jgi:hypothetical protein
MLVMSDRNGVVDGSIPGLARLSGSTIDETVTAIRTLSSEDEYSRTKENNGRRIEEVDGGWRILNFEKYHKMLDADETRKNAAGRQRKHRSEQKTVTTCHEVTNVTSGHMKSHDVRQVEVEVEVEVEAEVEENIKTGVAHDPCSTESPAYMVADALSCVIFSANPDHRYRLSYQVGPRAKWASDILLLHRQGITWELMLEVISWLPTDWWGHNISDAASFVQKFDVLRAKMRSSLTSKDGHRDLTAEEVAAACGGGELCTHEEMEAKRNGRS